MDIFEKDLSGAMVSPDEPGYDQLIGIGATVLPGVRIGYGSIIGANSVVTHDVPPMTVVGGNPAKFIKNIEARR